MILSAGQWEWTYINTKVFRFGPKWEHIGLGPSHSRVGDVWVSDGQPFLL